MEQLWADNAYVWTSEYLQVFKNGQFTTSPSLRKIHLWGKKTNSKEKSEKLGLSVGRQVPLRSSGVT